MDANLELQKVLGLLADPERFKIVSAVALGADTLEKISTMTGVSNPVIMKSLVKLEGAGLLTKNNSVYVFNMDVLQSINREYNHTAPKKAPLTGVERFMKDGKIITYPSRPDDRLMVLEYIIRLFEFNRDYPEKEVNQKLKTVFVDYASMRRYLYDNGFFHRQQKTESGRTVTYYRRLK